jgi:hypothetical protein
VIPQTLSISFPVVDLPVLRVRFLSPGLRPFSAEGWAHMPLLLPVAGSCEYLQAAAALSAEHSDAASHSNSAFSRLLSESSIVRFYVLQNAQNEVRYVPCCDAAEGYDM